MVAIELFKNGDVHQPDADLTKAIVAEAAKRGLILLSCGVYGNVIRILVPLTGQRRAARRGIHRFCDEKFGSPPAAAHAAPRRGG
jgi:4-aminobutyrate aminotransferase/(S)-3-amino-2-methylpropionate transaminase